MLITARILGAASVAVVLAATLQGCGGEQRGSEMSAGLRTCVRVGQSDGKACNGPCLDNNLAYGTLNEAEAACEANVECTMILQYIDGKFFLRRDADQDRGGFPGTTFLYKCTTGQHAAANATVVPHAEFGAAAPAAEEEDSVDEAPAPGSRAAEFGAAAPAAEEEDSVDEAPAPSVDEAPAPGGGALIGGAQDGDGCLTSAGFAWCASTAECLGPGVECQETASPLLEDKEDFNVGTDMCDLSEVVKSDVHLGFDMKAEMSTECCEILHEASRHERERVSTGAMKISDMKALYTKICDELKCPDQVKEAGFRDLLQSACTWEDEDHPLFLSTEAKKGRILRLANRAQ